MKKYNMIEKRQELTPQEVEQGMDFNKVLNNSNLSSKNYWKPITIAVISVICLITGFWFFYSTPATKNAVPDEKHKEIIPLDTLLTKPISVESFSLYVGTQQAKGDLFFTKLELQEIEGIQLKSSVAIPSFKIMSFTFTTLTKNGISQINCNSELFNAEIKSLLSSVKPGQTVYFENIVIQDQQGKQQVVDPITVTIK